jgi:hypothetical protein
MKIHKDICFVCEKYLLNQCPKECEEKNMREIGGEKKCSEKEQTDLDVDQT